MLHAFSLQILTFQEAPERFQIHRASWQTEVERSKG